MITKLAYKNILGNGWRSLINIFILSLVLTGMIWMQGLYDGWSRIARRQMQEWEFAGGHYAHQDYDKYDSFSLDKSFAAVPPKLQDLIDTGDAVPILYSAGIIYPHGRLTPVVIKGIPAEQNILRIPTTHLRIQDPDTQILPVLIGRQMAKSINVVKGDILTMRWKEVNGAYNAYDIQIVQIMDTPVPSTDMGQIWIDYDKLNEVKALKNSCSVIVLKNQAASTYVGSPWNFVSIDQSMKGVDAMIQTKRVGGYVFFVLLLFLAMIAVFDAQMLAVFKRRKEIGTLIALGMTKRQIIGLFTMEGTMYMLLGSVLTATLGLPLFFYFGFQGFPIPQQMSDFNIAGASEPIRCYYSPIMILSTFMIVMAVTVFASWLPSSKIARMKATYALLGKV
ncbi:MAG: ABC transporter permease [Candidatus Cloacimonetes bacterium HGW-Cloacimonetes-1]|jgi:ABC-type lipoprotein release transport system permease subunit|nr:MAG: ABC transporter permease [Candidatus Cloacimonetes bacterium HGW-Cloacimonetes-1]